MHIQSTAEAVASWLPNLGAVLAFSTYWPLYKMTRAGTAKQNIATFILWGLLDAIAAVSTFLQPHGNYLLPLLYVTGCIVIIIAIVRSSMWKWGFWEWVATFFVGLSIILWMRSGSEWAIIFSALGVGVAMLPQLIDAWNEPDKAPYKLYYRFVIGNMCSLATLAIGHRFTIEEHFYGAVCTAATLVFVIVAIVRMKALPQPQTA